MSTAASLVTARAIPADGEWMIVSVVCRVLGFGGRKEN
jgi:hypothetical protein